MKCNDIRSALKWLLSTIIVEIATLINSNDTFIIAINAFHIVIALANLLMYTYYEIEAMHRDQELEDLKRQHNRG
ncbi:MAG: hypothetical protein BWK73_26765 [Thiothrix lacustris]|uniref:Uncharacterized protein n=1 Tax=Thiothrix lacustris TaxID=525917 RepID=A0A1Y1QKW3_9GAMM|nr:MAG: hypothetical protein BWK73_26765 [Thiothrix lacustris]